MRLLRTLSALSLLVFAGFGAGVVANAQSVEEERADAARREAERANSLVDVAQAARAGIEDELAESLALLTQINAELSRLASDLDTLAEVLGNADRDYALLADNVTRHVVEAYVRAVTSPATSLVGTDSAEAVLVASTSLESALASDQADIARLAVLRRELELLRAEYLAEQRQLDDVRRRADAETGRLEALLAEADARVAAAVAEARRADAAYRAALDSVESARAREEERRRQEQRDAATTTTTTTVGRATTPSSPSPGPFPAAVERWRPLVSAFFPPVRVEEALAVIQCESLGDPDAYNPYSGAAGLFQFLPTTWATVSPRAGFGGASVFDPEANIGTAAWLVDYYTSRGAHPWSAWTCRP